MSIPEHEVHYCGQNQATSAQCTDTICSATVSTYALQHVLTASPPLHRHQQGIAMACAAKCKRAPATYAYLVNLIDMHLGICSSRSRRRSDAVRVQGSCDRVKNLADWLRNIVSQIVHSILKSVAQIFHGFHHLSCACGFRSCYNWLYRCLCSLQCHAFATCFANHIPSFCKSVLLTCKPDVSCL